MGKRIVPFILMLTVLLSGSFAVIAQAATVNKAFLVEQAKGKAPDVKLYMTGTEMSAQVPVSGSITDIALSQNGEIRTFDETGEGIRIIVLFDNSGSINKEQFKEAKKQLKKLRKNLKNNDELQIYTVGTTDINSDKTDVLEGTASAVAADQLQADLDKIGAIPYIEDREGKTILYRSINQVLEEQAAQTSINALRTVILLITDGEDDSDDVNGMDNDKDATLENVQNSSIPIYGILLNNTIANPNAKKIKFTKNKILNSDNGHGYYYNCSADEDAGAVKKAFKKMDEIFRQQTYVVNLIANTNKAVAGKNILNIAVNNQAIDPIMADYSDYTQEADAPVIVGSVKKEGKNSITFSIEDANGVNLADASDQTHYNIQKDAKDGAGKVWTIDQVNANQNGGNVQIKLTVKEKEFFNGDYTLIVSGIRDESQDQNVMTNVKAVFSVEDGLDEKEEARKELLQKYWWIALIALIIVIGVIVIIIAKKKSVKIIEKEIDIGELNHADSKMIRLTITDRSGAIKDVEWNVEGSLFVGRSDICNIFFDDDRLSKQHFVIEVTKLGCYIDDLESTNGTFVNGVKMTNRRLLLDGDVITAGREKFVFHVAKNEIPIEETDEEYTD